MSIKTVLGDISPKDLGMTLTHEHIHMDYQSCFFQPPRECHKEKIHSAMEMKNLGFIYQYPYSHVANLSFAEETLDSMIEEVKEFKRFGGSTLVEVTTHGIQPDYAFLKKVAEATGINIVCSTGYYLGQTQKDDTKNLNVDTMIENMLKDLTIGRDGVVAGCIGEIGCQYPLEEFEKKSLIAAAKTQSQMLCPLIIHPGRSEKSPFEIIDILRDNDAIIDKTVMSHLDRTLIHDYDVMVKFAKYSSCYLEFDLFGIEKSHYQANLSFDFPSDAQRIQCIKMLLDNGFEDRILIAHDIHTRHRLLKYGGHGYGHILENIVPKMLDRGITKLQVDKILIQNPTKWLTW